MLAVLLPVDGKFTVNCGNKAGRYLYVQLVGLQRQLWVGEIKAVYDRTRNARAGNAHTRAGTAET